MGFKEVEDRSGARRYWPIIGFVLIVVLGVIAYVLAPSVYEATKDLFPAFRTPGIKRQTILIGYTIVIFLVLTVVAGGVVALAQPKPKIKITDKELMKLRQETLDRKEEDKKRMRKVNREMRRR
jgi:hypothetical protein